MKKFIKFLEANNAWENFKREFIKEGRNAKHYKDMCEKWNGGELESAFPWEYTKEGYDYWAGLNRKWKEKKKSLK